MRSQWRISLIVCVILFHLHRLHSSKSAIHAPTRPPYHCPHHLPAIHPSLFPLVEEIVHPRRGIGQACTCVCILKCSYCTYFSVSTACDYICLAARSHRSRRGMGHRTEVSHPRFSTFSQTRWPLPRQKRESMTSDLQIKKNWYWDFSKSISGLGTF